MRVWLILLLLAGCASPGGNSDNYENPYTLTDEPEGPDIVFAKNDPDKKLMVYETEPNVKWSQLDTRGCTEPSKPMVEEGDEMTSCRGTVTITYKPNGATLYSTTF